MNNPDILFNSIARCGNTFLVFAFGEAIRQNIDGGEDTFYENRQLYSHSHWPFLLRLDPEQTNTIQFTNFRHPLENIPSLFALPHYRSIWKHPGIKNKDVLEDRVIEAIREYILWTKTQTTYNFSNVILFEDIKNDVNLVLKFIFDKLGIEFKNNIDIEKVKNDLRSFEDERYLDEKERFNMGRLPRGFSETEQYKQIQEILLNENWVHHISYKEAVNRYEYIYNEKRAN